MLVEQRFRGDEKSRRAVAALGGAEIGKCLLQRMQPSVRHESLNRRHGRAVAVDAEHQARQHRLAIEEDGARTALAELAPVLRAAQVQVLTQHLEQCFVRSERDVGRFAVHRERDGDHEIAHC